MNFFKDLTNELPSHSETITTLLMLLESHIVVNSDPGEKSLTKSLQHWTIVVTVAAGVCDVPLCNNPTSLEAFKEHSETIIDSNDDNSSSDDDYPYGEDIDYVDASPPDVEIVSLEVVEIVDPIVMIFKERKKRKLNKHKGKHGMERASLGDQSANSPKKKSSFRQNPVTNCPCWQSLFIPKAFRWLRLSSKKLKRNQRLGFALDSPHTTSTLGFISTKKHKLPSQDSANE
ncbi:hypothetical protein Tco_0412117 [Tanacetum coccineum]